MMHRCSEAHGQCSCGFFHNQNGSFSLLFGHKNFDDGNLYSFSSSTSGVDCTLSLGTPSTRLSSCDAEKRRSSSSSSCMSNFCWDFLHSNSHNQSTGSKGRRGGSHGNSNFGGGGETLLARRCANCDTTSTPLWRNGPKGPKSLCNACGIRFKKEERRATTAAATTNTNDGGTGAVDAHNMLNNSWIHHAQNQKVSSYISSTYGNEFRFTEEDYDRDSDTGAGAIPFLSWRPNVTTRPSLVHNFTM